MNVLRLMRTEVIKQKRNLLWWFLFIIPAGTTLAMFLDMYIRYEDYLSVRMKERGMTSWDVLIRENHGVLNWGFFLPLFIAIICAFLYHTEVKPDNWKKTLSLPVSRTTVFLSKFLMILLFGFTLILLNALGLLFVGKLTGFPEAFPYVKFAKYIGLQFAGILGVAAIQNGLSVFSKNAIQPIVFAFLAMIVGGVLLAKETVFNMFYPYVHPFVAGGITSEEPILALYGGVGTGAIFLLLGLFFFQKKDII